MRVSERDVKVEASIPAATRVDIRTLAMLSEYWQGIDVQVLSVSQLINWSLEVLLETLRRNEKVGREIESISEAERVMNEAGLVQRSMMRRGYKKLLMAKGFQELRYQGEEPSEYAKASYKVLHNPHSVKTAGERPKVDRVEEAERILKDIEHKQRMKALEEAKSRIADLPRDESGVVLVQRSEKRGVECSSERMEELQRIREQKDGEQLKQLTRMNRFVTKLNGGEDESENGGTGEV